MTSNASTNATAGPSREGWHTASSLRVPFLTSSHASTAKAALDVDREQNAFFVERKLTVDGSGLIIDFATTTVRLLRLTTNSFLSSLDLLVRTMAEFAPDPDVPRMSDDEVRRIADEANAGVQVGIELKGDGKGAGSGQEVR